MKRKNRISFQSICEDTKYQAAEAAWNRAKGASALRHAMVSSRRFAAATRCGEAKAKALRLVASLLPDQVQVTIDDDFQVGLVSVRWKGHGRFHLPADCGDDLRPGRSLSRST